MQVLSGKGDYARRDNLCLCMFEEDKQNIKNKNMLRSEPKPMKRKVLAVLLSLCMLLPLLPVAAFAAEDLTFGNGDTAKTFKPVPKDRMSFHPVDGTEMEVTDGAVTYTINATEGDDWVQDSGEGSNQAYTYVGLYVAMPEGAVSLKQNFEGDPENMDDVAADSLFLADRKYQSWYPVAEGRGGDNGEPPFSLFSGGREYTLLLEWYDEQGNLLENGREYVKVTRELGKDVAKVQVGELTYATFEAALEAALEANPTKPEVTLLADVDVSLELPAGVELAVNVMDDNGDWHTLTNTNADYVCVKGDETEEGRTDVYKLADTLVVGEPVVDEEAGSVTTNVNGVLPADETTVEVSVTTGAEGAQDDTVTSSAVTISANAMASIEGSTVKTVDIKTDVATLSVNSDAWSTMAEALSAVTLTVSVADKRGEDGGKLVYTLTAKDEEGDDVFTESTGSITVSVGYTEGMENAPVVYYLSDKGAVQLDTVAYDKETGALSWSVNHFSEYEVADNAYEASVTTADGTTTTYATVGEALEAVAASGGTVNLLADEATVDSLSLTIAGDVVIKGTGTINVTVEDVDDKNTSVFTIKNTGSLTLDGVKMVVNGVQNEGQGSDGTAFTLYGNAGGVGSEVIVKNGGELDLRNLNKGFIMGGPAPSTAKVTVKNGVLNASGIDGNFSNGGEFVFDHATVDIVAGVDQVSEWVGHALSVHKLTATASKITASASKYGLNITDEGGKVELLEGSTLEVKDSGTKFDDGTAAANMQKGSTLVVDKTSTLSVTGTNNKLHLDEAGTSVLLGTVEADMNTVPYIYAVGFKANAADANETINKLFTELAQLVEAEGTPDPITDCDDNTMFVLFTGTGTTDTYTLTVTKGADQIYTENLDATKGGVIYFTFEQDGGSHTSEAIASGTYTLTVESDEPKVVGTTDITLAKVSFEPDGGGNAPAAFYGAAGDTVKLPADKPTKTGYNFAGWKNVDGGEDAETFKAGAAYLMGSEDVTLTAQWNRRNSGGGAPSGGGGSAVTEYAVTVSTADNGSVAVSPKNAEKGDTVTVTVTPDEGYVLESLTVTDKDGDKVSTTKGEDGKYTFTMPGSTVTVKAVFAEEGTVSELPFEDVKVEQWFYEAVKYVYDNELMNGISATEFNPNGLLTRGTIAQVLFNLEGADADAAAVFDDVPADAWFADAVNWAAANNIVTGYGDGTFGPDNNITREQMAAILYRYAQFKGYDVSAKGDLTAFTDGDNVSEWATDALAWCVGAKLINGRDNGTVDATGTATRAEIAQIFMNFCENIAK